MLKAEKPRKVTKIANVSPEWDSQPPDSGALCPPLEESLRTWGETGPRQTQSLLLPGRRAGRPVTKLFHPSTGASPRGGQPPPKTARTREVLPLPQGGSRLAGQAPHLSPLDRPCEGEEPPAGCPSLLEPTGAALVTSDGVTSRSQASCFRALKTVRPGAAGWGLGGLRHLVTDEAHLRSRLLLPRLSAAPPAAGLHSNKMLPEPPSYTGFPWPGSGFILPLPKWAFSGLGPSPGGRRVGVRAGTSFKKGVLNCLLLLLFFVQKRRQQQWSLRGSG